MRRGKIKSYLIGFRKYLQDKGSQLNQGLSDNTIKSRLAGVKSFYCEFRSVRKHGVFIYTVYALNKPFKKKRQ